MGVLIQAIYERGVFRLLNPESLPLKDGKLVELTVEMADHSGPSKSAYEHLMEVAGLPSEGPNDGFSGADHDRILYGDINGSGDVR